MLNQLQQTLAIRITWGIIGDYCHFCLNSAFFVCITPQEWCQPLVGTNMSHHVIDPINSTLGFSPTMMMTTPSQQLSNIRWSCFKIVSNRMKRVNIGHFQLNHPEETQHCKFVSKFAQKRVNVAQPPFNYLFDKIVLLQLPISCHSISKYFYTCFERSKHRPLAFELPWK